MNLILVNLRLSKRSDLRFALCDRSVKVTAESPQKVALDGVIGTIPV
ncbi:hypothetical protein [Funiculus sociatus]|nr:hypothetical protein [Trichocoleus sp. FACHB-69]